MYQNNNINVNKTLKTCNIKDCNQSRPNKIYVKYEWYPYLFKKCEFCKVLI